MTQNEFARMAMAIRTYYPKENILPNEQAMELWYQMLMDIPYEVACTALSTWAATNKWSPSISDLRQSAMEITGNELPEWGEAWKEVTDAVKRFGMYRESEAMNSFRPLTKKVAGQIGFGTICRSENVEVERANFRMLYERLAEKEKSAAAVPISVRNSITSIKQNLLEVGNHEINV